MKSGYRAMATGISGTMVTKAIPLWFLPPYSTNSCLQPSSKNPFVSFLGRRRDITATRQKGSKKSTSSRCHGVFCGLLPVDPWAPTVDSQSIASELFAASLFPYLGFLYFITKSKSSPKLTLFGFYFLLAFVGATIPAGIYAKVKYGTSLSNVDWLHGGAEFLLTLTNLFIVIGLREALRKLELEKTKSSTDTSAEAENKTSV